MTKFNNQIVIVLGSHRSGTSVTTRLVSYLGFNLGENLMEPNNDNPKGYFEDIDIYNFNEKILKLIKRSWYDSDHIDSKLLINLTKKNIFNEAVTLIKKKINHQKPIIIKDPRITILLPFWAKVFKKLNLNIKYVCSIRNPLDISLSLKIRDGFSINNSLNIWYRYTSQLLLDLKFKDAVFINFDNFKENLDKEIIKLEIFFNKKFTKESLEKFKSFYEKSLLHSKHKPKDFYDSNLISDLYKDIYSQCLDLSINYEVSSSNEKLIKKNVNKIVNTINSDPLFKNGMNDLWYKKNAIKNDHALDNLLEQRDRAIIQINKLETETIKKNNALNSLLEQRDRAISQITILETETIKRDDTANDLLKQRDRAIIQINKLETETIKKNNSLNDLLNQKDQAISQITKLQTESKRKEDVSSNLLEQRENALNALLEQRDRAIDQITKLKTEGKRKEVALSNLLEQKNNLSDKKNIEISNLEKINLEAVFQINNLENQVQETLTEYNKTINSKSMKITKPLRFILAKYNYLIFKFLKIIKKLNNIYKRKFITQMIMSKFFRSKSSMKINFNSYKLKNLYIYMLSNYRFKKKLQYISDKFNNKPIEISIIIPVYNKWNYTIPCIKSILDQEIKNNFEIIIMDDNSSDLMPKVLNQTLNRKFNIIKYYKNKSNLGFIKNCNVGSKYASGEFIVFLNNDTLVDKRWLSKLKDTFNLNENIGVVGSKIMFQNNRLQEAGGIIWDDATGMNYGRNEDPDHPRFNYLREVSYVSGCSFMVNKLLFLKTGGFDEELNTAYYEDVAKCFQLSNLGYKIVYQPESFLMHYEGVTNGTNLKKGIKRFQEINKEIFYKKYIVPLSKNNKKLLSKPKNESDIILASEIYEKERILVIDNNIPTPDKDEGSQYIWNLLKYLKKENNLIKFIAADELSNTRNNYFRNLEQIGIEVGQWPHYSSVNDFIEKNKNIFSVVLITRVNNHKKYYEIVKKNNQNAKIIFNTIDLHHLRHLREAEVLDNNLIRKEALKLKDVEIECINKSDQTILVSNEEYKYLKKIRVKIDNVHVLPLLRDFTSRTEIKSFNSRKNSIVFLGNFNHTPNVDAIKFIINDIWPKLENECVKRNIKLPCLDIVGDDMPENMKYIIKNLKLNVKYHGYVKDLEKFFEEVKLSIAPLRYGAGLKGKIITSFQYGVPVIGSQIAFEGIDHKKIDTGIPFINENVDEYVNCIITILNDENEWYKLSRSLVKFVNDTYSIDKNKNKINEIFY